MTPSPPPFTVVIVIVIVPLATAVISPVLALIVAIEGLLLINESVLSVASAGSTVAVRFTVSPIDKNNEVVFNVAL